MGLRGCKYALMNVKKNYTAALASRETETPINYVPLVYLYYNGRPFKRYTSEYTFEALKNFIINASKESQNAFQPRAPAPAQASRAPQAPAPQQEETEHGYTTGKPYCDDEEGICYLSFDKAYSGTANS